MATFFRKKNTDLGCDLQVSPWNQATSPDEELISRSVRYQLSFQGHASPEGWKLFRLEFGSPLSLEASVILHLQAAEGRDEFELDLVLSRQGNKTYVGVAKLPSMKRVIGVEVQPGFQGDSALVSACAIPCSSLSLGKVLIQHKLRMFRERPWYLRRFLQNLLPPVRHFDFRNLFIQLRHELNKRDDRDDYPGWISVYDSLQDEDRQKIKSIFREWPEFPRFLILVPGASEKDRLFERTLRSLRSQIYPHWKTRTERLANQDLDSAELCLVLRPGDELSEHALFLFAREFRRNPDLSLIYTDEDKIDQNGRRFDPFFKPDWNEALFCSNQYLKSAYAVSTTFLKLNVNKGEILEAWGGLLTYKLILNNKFKQIVHLPHVLFHAYSSREKSNNSAQIRHFLRNHFRKRGFEVRVGKGPGSSNRIIFPLGNQPPSVSLVICTRNQVKLLNQIVRGVLHHTDYPSMELLIVNNQSDDPETLRYLDWLRSDPRVRVLDYDAPFNFSAMNNLAAQHASGEVLGFLNNDLKVISRKWLSEMVSHAIRPEIGAVGAKLLYANKTIQHAGVALGIGWGAGHIYKSFYRRALGSGKRLQCVQYFSAVTAACMVMRSRLFREVGGFDEKMFAVAFNDVDLCLKLRERGYSILWTPYAELYHFESVSRGSDLDETVKHRFFREVDGLHRKWGHILRNDPFYNPNLSLYRENLSLAFPPRVRWDEG